MTVESENSWEVGGKLDHTRMARIHDIVLEIAPPFQHWASAHRSPDTDCETTTDFLAAPERFLAAVKACVSEGQQVDMGDWALWIDH